MIENKEIILSTSRNLNFYLLDYKEREVQNELDLVNNTLILSKLNNNENIYLNNFAYPNLYNHIQFKHLQ